MTQNELIDFSQHTPRFGIDGDALCLDFANTLDYHASASPVEGLNQYTDLLAWGFEAGLLTADEANTLAHLSAARSTDAQAALNDAIYLREAIYRIFVAYAHEHPVDPQDLSILTHFWRLAAQHLRLVSRGDQVAWEWEMAPDDLRHVLWPVIRSAVEILHSDLRRRIGQCQDDRGCGVLFIDTSRNRTRRWCSMESCGNRAKANRHYTRIKK